MKKKALELRGGGILVLLCSSRIPKVPAKKPLQALDHRAVHIADFCIARCIGDAELVLRTHWQCTYQIDALLDPKYIIVLLVILGDLGDDNIGETVLMIRNL
jgi:hypothetical protein